MSLLNILQNVSQDERNMILGQETSDPLHKAFIGKRTVHAGLQGRLVEYEAVHEIWGNEICEAVNEAEHCAIYIHIPFCQTKCLYCAFFQNKSRQAEEDIYIEGLISEIECDSKKIKFETSVIESVFIGGGTPTSLSVNNVKKLFNAIHKNFTLSPTCEITLEGRVNDLIPEKIEAWLKCGVNRISLGIQTFDTKIRQQMGRIDTKEKIIEKIKLLKSFRACTLIADLMYGMPGQTKEILLEDLRLLSELDFDGMDLYQLNIFPGTGLEQAIKKRLLLEAATTEKQADLYVLAREYLVREKYTRLSACHWSRSNKERNKYNSMAKSGAVIYPFGAGAGGNIGGYSLMLHRHIMVYQKSLLSKQKPIMMMAKQNDFQQDADFIVKEVELGKIDFKELCRRNIKFKELEYILEYWKKNKLMYLENGIYYLTIAGEFWYLNITQSLIECMAGVLTGKISCINQNVSLQDKKTEVLPDILVMAIAEAIPNLSLKESKEMVKKIPEQIQIMLKNTPKESLVSMIKNMSPEMWGKMIGAGKEV